MSTTPKPSNIKTVVVEINGQQKQMLERLVAKDQLGRTAEEIIRQGSWNSPRPSGSRKINRHKGSGSGGLNGGAKTSPTIRP